jgi:hypothetical protein
MVVIHISRFKSLIPKKPYLCWNFKIISPREAGRQGLGRQGFIPAPLHVFFLPFPLRTRVFFFYLLMIKIPAGDKTRL